MTRAARKTNRHPSIHGQDGAALLARLDAERNPPVCALCETRCDKALCDPCDKQLAAELRRPARRLA